jgi:arylsulfatase A-like enzyme
LKRWFYADARKDARSINRAVLEWLVHRPDQARPFFVFLNFMDAHAPYKLPEGAHQHFGYEPRSRDEIRAIHESWDLIDKLTLPRHYLTMARDAYDSCLAYLDEQLGALFAELRRGGLLDNTVVVILADHGEGLGEHDLFDHGESLYSTELNVPLLVLLPRERRITGVVSEAVSLRDLPATVVDLVGLAAGSPFPGQSLAPLWRDPNRPEASVSPVVSELLVPDPRNANQGRSPAYRGPLVSLAEGDYVYIRNLGDGGEQLFNTRDDPGELSNRVGLATMKSLLDRFRKRIAHEVTGDSR